MATAKAALGQKRVQEICDQAETTGDANLEILTAGGAPSDVVDRAKKHRTRLLDGVRNKADEFPFG